MKSVIKRLRFPLEIMLVCVRWYVVVYPLSLRNLEEMMHERGVTVDHSTIQRWTLRRMPVLERTFRKRKAAVMNGMVEGIHFFKTQPEKTMKILEERFTNHGQMDAAVARATYQSYAKYFEAKLCPTMAAIENVYQEAIRQDEDAAKINPTELWDLHFVRRLDDSGFIDDLYRGGTGGQG